MKHVDILECALMLFVVTFVVQNGTKAIVFLVKFVVNKFRRVK